MSGRWIALGLCAVLVSATGCIVSKKTYLLKEEEAKTCAAKLEQKTSEAQSCANELSATQGQLQASNTRVRALSTQVVGLTREKTDLAEQKKVTDALNTELKSQNDRLNSLLEQKEVSQAQVIKETMDINKKLQATNTELREKVVTCETENRRFREDIAQAGAARDSLQTQNTALTAQVDDLKKRREQELAQLKSTYDELVTGLKSEIEAGEIQIRRMKDRLSVNLVEKILFDSGSAEIKPKGIEVLRKVGGELAKIESKRVQIEGHTDNVPIGGRLKERFPSNWELSATRALSVVHFLQDQVKIDPVNLSAAGYGQYQPASENETNEGKASNRRIEIVLLPPYERTGEAQETTGAPAAPSAPTAPAQQ